MKKTLTYLPKGCLLIAAYLWSFSVLAQNVTGKVTDENGQGIPGTSILEKGTRTGVTASADGTFSLKVSSSKAVLILTSVGYKSKEVEVNNRTVVNVVLDSDASQLSEVVVVGYGTQKKKDLTGAVASVNLKQFEDSPNTNIFQSLQGSVAGVTVGQTATAGTDPTLTVRGRSTLGGNQSVLIILDGSIYRGNFTDLNPADIQSVDVLKDPSSKAIYGAQAANGIIMVTSKKGKSNQKTEVSYSTFYSMQSPIQNRRTLNRAEFIENARNEAYTKGFLPPGFTTPNPDFNYLRDSGIAANADLTNSINNGTDFNWFAAGQNANPYIVDHQLSVKGGSEKTTYFLSAGYTDQLGWILNDNYTRNSVRLNIDTQVNDWLKVGVNTFGAFSDRSGVSPNLETFVLMNPLFTPTKADGSFIINPTGGSLVNPFLQVQADDLNKQNNIGAQAYISIDIPWVKGLNYRLNYNNNLRWNNFFNSNKFGANGAGSATKTNNSTYDTAYDHILSYDTFLDKSHFHNLKATLVYGRNRIENETTTASATQFTNLTLGYNNIGAGTIPLVSSGGYNEAFVSTTARVIYDFKGKYLFNASIRRDGHSAFSPNNKIGYFPAVSAGWVISEESFLANNPKINLLKIRGSYGLNGNTSTRYSAQQIYVSNVANQYVFGDGGTPVNSFALSTLISPDLTWEKTAGANIGLDFGFLNNRIEGSIDYYNSTTKDLIYDRALSATTGVNSIRLNIGEILNTGLEFNVNFIPVRTQNLTWNFGVNFSTNNNKIVRLTGEDNNGDGREDDLIQNNFFIGKSIGAIYTYEQIGLHQLGDALPAGYTPGSYKFKDQNGDNIIDEKDRVFIGRREANYQFGITNNITYKNFSLRMFINSVQGGLGENDPWGGTAFYGNTNYVASNRFNDIDYWTPSNPNAEYAKAGIVTNGNVNFTPFRDRSFVRLQDVSLAYTFNKGLIKKVGLSNVKLYVSGKNLATWTAWKGWDPETGAGLGISQIGLPVMKSFNVGLDLVF